MRWLFSSRIRVVMPLTCSRSSSELKPFSSCQGTSRTQLGVGPSLGSPTPELTWSPPFSPGLSVSLPGRYFPAGALSLQGAPPRFPCSHPDYPQLAQLSSHLVIRGPCCPAALPQNQDPMPTPHMLLPLLPPWPSQCLGEPNCIHLWGRGPELGLWWGWGHRKG